MKWFLDHVEEFFMIPLIFAMSIIIFIQVVCRYVFQNSLTWSEEMARYMFVWLVYFSVSYTARREKHIRIDAAINLYPKKARPYIEILSEVIGLCNLHRCNRLYCIRQDCMVRSDVSRNAYSYAVRICGTYDRHGADSNSSAAVHLQKNQGVEKSRGGD